MTLIHAKWTIADYHRMIAAGILDDRPVELLNGEIIEMSPEGVPHAGLSSAGADYLRDRLGNRAKIRQGNPITLPDHSEPEPDLAIVEPIEEVYIREHHPYPENIFWLIEFADSSLSKDTEVKRKLYAAAGIREYWVINLRTLELIVYRDPHQGDYQQQMTVTQEEISPLAFPDVAISVSRLLRRP